jgi:hypothetical protein
VAARAVATLAPEERRRGVLYAQNYGEAGALEYFAEAHGIADVPVASGHNAYWMWGPPPADRGDVLVIVGGRAEDHRRSYVDVVAVGETHHPYAMPYENHLPVYVCRGARQPLALLWPSVKRYQ